MKIENRRISELKPYEKNAKNHPKEQVEKIAKSIKRFGWKNPVLIDKDGLIIAGHGRVLGAKHLGMEEVPCIMADDLTPEEVKAYRLADNKLAESEWDMDLVISELEILPDELRELSGFNIEDLKFSPDSSDIPRLDEKEPITCPSCGHEFEN